MNDTQQYAVLMFPGDTTVKITGNAEVVKQIINALDGINITYTLQ